MPIFGSKIGIALGSSGSFELPTTSSLQGISFLYTSPTSSDIFTTSSIASIGARVISSNETGSAGELIFLVPSPQNDQSAGDTIFRISATGSNNEPRVAIGFEENETILKPFEVKSKIESDKGTEILIRSSRTGSGAQAGDEAGSINFVIDSSSFNDITTTGSIARIKTRVNDDPSATQGVNGQLTFAISRNIDTEIDVMDMAYDQSTYSTLYSTVTSHSFELKDTNPQTTTTQNASFILSNGTNPYVIIRTDNPGTGNQGGLIQVNNKFGTGNIFLHGPSGEITASNINASGDITATSITFADGDTGTNYPSSLTSDGGVGDIIKVGSTTGMNAGDLYYWNGTSWATAANTTAATSSLLGIAAGASSATDGHIIRGIVQTGDSVTAGAPVYMTSFSGRVSSNVPTTSGQAVRIIGYAISNQEFYFNPSPDWFTIE